MDTEPGMPIEPSPIEPQRRRTYASRAEIVYLDPHLDRPVSQYSPEGEIRMMGEFAAGLSRNSNLSRPMAFLLVAVILLPIALSILAVVSGW
ncbi:MAG TPA: hypothetical protein VGH11_08530 [Jatrophihabitans sp.]